MCEHTSSVHRKIDRIGLMSTKSTQDFWKISGSQTSLLGILDFGFIGIFPLLGIVRLSI